MDVVNWIYKTHQIRDVTGVDSKHMIDKIKMLRIGNLHAGIPRFVKLRLLLQEIGRPVLVDNSSDCARI